MEVLRNGWFTELSPDQVPGSQVAASPDTCWTGQAFSLEVKKVLYHERSEFQDILVFESESYGNVLVLDNVIQCTERDEFAYQEMMAHVPMCSHPNPRNVLIVGGGDGGVMREILKHDCVESVTLCEIDAKVIEVSKSYLPKMAASFAHPKARLHVGDGFQFMRDHKNEFDVIVTDSSDPIGPAQALFEDSYFELVKSALKHDGILVSQAESFWLHPSLIGSMHRFCARLYPSVGYAYLSIPTYTSGVIGFMICSKLAKFQRTDLATPKRPLLAEDVQRMGLRYYNVQVHSAAFVLPQFAKQIIEDASTS